MKHSSPSDLFARLARLLEEDAAASRDRTLRPTRSDRLAAAGRRLTDFDSVHDLSDLLDAAAVLLKEGQVRGSNPRYFGFFRGAPDLSTSLAEALTAWFDPQLALRVEAREAVALESAVADRLGEGLGFGLEPGGASAQFTTGASASNTTAVLCALAAKFEDFESAGLAGKPPLAIYASEDAHGSLEKAVVAAGLGREALHRIAVDDDRRLRPDALAAQIEVDRRRGREPLAIVATLGTTAAGAVDPVDALADLAAREGLYLHVDAAWGGLAGWCPRGRALTEGLPRADSLAVDLHKTIGLPTGQGLLFLRDRKLAARLFSPRDAAYMPAVNERAEDPYRTTPLWSRRFQGLAAAFRLLTLGRQGLENSLDRLFVLADRLEEKLREAGWSPRRHSELPLVLFEDPHSPAPAEEIARRVRRRGKVWLAAVNVGDRSWLRAAFSHSETGESDLDDLISELQAVRDDLRRAAK